VKREVLFVEVEAEVAVDEADEREDPEPWPPAHPLVDAREQRPPTGLVATVARARHPLIDADRCHLRPSAAAAVRTRPAAGSASSRSGWRTRSGRRTARTRSCSRK